MSAFFGSQMKFTRPEETERSTNRGYIGYLVSAGTKHIKEQRADRRQLGRSSSGS